MLSNVVLQTRTYIYAYYEIQKRDSSSAQPSSPFLSLPLQFKTPFSLSYSHMHHYLQSRIE